MSIQTSTILNRYERAAKVFEGQFTNKGYMNDMVIAHWIADSGSFFYVRQTKKWARASFGEYTRSH